MKPLIEFHITDYWFRTYLDFLLLQLNTLLHLPGRLTLLSCSTMELMACTTPLTKDQQATLWIMWSWVLVLEYVFFFGTLQFIFEVLRMQLEAKCSILVLTPQCFVRQAFIYEVVLKDLQKLCFLIQNLKHKP